MHEVVQEHKHKKELYSHSEKQGLTAQMNTTKEKVCYRLSKNRAWCNEECVWCLVQVVDRMKVGMV